MRVLLTGATGYLGSHLAHAFVSAGHEVAAVVRASSDTSRISTILATLRRVDPSALFEVLADFQPEAIVHAATCYGRQGELGSELVEANVQFPLKLLEYAANIRTPVFINTDTTLPSTLNGYALSKSQFVHWSKLLVGDMRIANVRLESLYGPGDDETKFPTQLVRACVRGDSELKLSPGEQMRDYIYIDDAVAAYLTILGKALIQSEPWQDYGLGTGIPTTIREFAETVKRESDSRTTLSFGALPYRARELMRSCADPSVLESLGWRHRTALAEGIRKVIVFERIACGC